MKRKFLAFIGAALMLAALMILSSCGDPPYEELAEDGYSVCIRFDANGGDFANNGTYLSVVDVYHTSEDTIQLFDPKSEIREPKEIRYDVQKSVSDYKLDGWYVVATNEKGEILDEDGNPTSQSGKEPKFLSDKAWDFEKDRFKIDKSKTYTADVPALTLCAKWVPHYKFEFYIKDASGDWIQFTKSTDDGEDVLTYSGNAVKLPGLNIGRSENCTAGYGNWDFYSEFNPTSYDQFPWGSTLSGAYLDPECTNAIPLTAHDSPNVFDGRAYYSENPDLDPLTDPIKIYTTWDEGNWFSIYTADQFSSVFASIYRGALTDVKLRIMADLDFASSDYGWLLDDLAFDQHFDEGAFEGINLYIDGNGHSFSGIHATANASSTYGGIFKKLGSSAVITDLTIENSSFTVPAYTGRDVVAFGLFAGSVADGAIIENVKLTNCTLKISNTVSTDKLTDGTIEVYADAPTPLSGIDYSGVSVSAPDTLSAEIVADGYVKFREI